MTVMVAAALYSHLAAAQPEVKDLRCENLGSPLGIDQPQPPVVEVGAGGAWPGAVRLPSDRHRG